MNKKKAIYAIDIRTKKVDEYDSVAQAAEAVYGNRYLINKVIDTEMTAFGKYWRTKE